jgi:deoxyribose-phosphate aldolase
MGKKISVIDIAKMCDHSLLRPTLTNEEFVEGIDVVKEYCCKTVMVAPYDVPKAVNMLQGSQVEVSTVVDFPHGMNLTESKVFQAQRAIEKGAKHIDMVLGISRVVSGNYDEVIEDVRCVVDASRQYGVLVKVILETCYLSNRMIVAACKACELAGAAFVKTSTGYGPGGATLDVVRLMRNSVGPAVEVKASGGIRTLDQVLEYRKAGASMIGSRSTAQLLIEAARREKEGTLAELD